jgi:hypothetical protein
MDGDPVAIERLYRSLEPPRQRTILPLVVDLADPSPGLGWRGAERPPLADRGRPDLVLALALLHHLTLARNVPLAEVVQWLLDLGGELVVEFVHRDDPMIALLLRNKTDTYADYDRAAFEGLLRVRAQIVRQTTVPGDTRTLDPVRPRPGGLRAPTCRTSRSCALAVSLADLAEPGRVRHERRQEEAPWPTSSRKPRSSPAARRASAGPRRWHWPRAGSPSTPRPAAPRC